MSLLLDSTSPSPPSNDSNHGLLSLDQHKPVPAPFLTKTYQLVDDTSTDHIVSWGDDSSTFVVWRPPEFARDLLPNYFKHNNFSSFVRQLNTYGFRKIVPERWEFANEFFRKGEKHLLCEIHRRKTCSSSSSSSSSSCSPPVTHYPFHFPFQNYPYHKSSSISLGFNPNAGCFSSDDQMLPNWANTSSSNPKYMAHNNAIPLSSSASVLIEDNERLRRSNSMLVSELSHMKKLYNDIIYFVQNHVRPVAPSNAYPSSLPLTTSGFSTGGGGNLFQRTSNGDKYNKKQDGVVVGCLNSGSTTSSSSLTIVEEEDDDGKDEPLKKTETKLFGVQVQLGLSSSSSFCNNKKRPFEYPTSSSPPPPPPPKEPRFVLSNEDLGFNLMPKSCLA